MPSLRIEFVPTLLSDPPSTLREPIAVGTLPLSAAATAAGSQIVVPATGGALQAIISSDVPTYIAIDPSAPNPLAEPRMLILPSLPRVLPVSAGRRIGAVLAAAQNIFTVTIAAGEALSSAVDLGSLRLLRVDMPDQWTAAKLVPYVSADGVTYGPLVGCDPAGSPAANFSASSRNDAESVWPSSGRPSLLRTVRFLKLKSVSDQLADVTQAAARTITLLAA